MPQFWSCVGDDPFHIGCTGQTVYVFDKAGTDMTKFKDLFYIGKAKAMCYILENNYSNGYQEEIAYRFALRKKVTGGVKLSKEERLWLETHKEFSQIYGVPILKTDVITLEKGKNYQFDVTFVESLHPGKIYPWFKAPSGMGSILTDVELTDYRGKKSIGKPVKLLATEISAENRSFRFSYSSDCGVLSVGFFCEFYDQKQHLHTGGFSSGAEGLYMLREDMGPSCVLYRCKSRNADTFDSLVFSVEWKMI